MFDIQDYLTPEGEDPYAIWLASLKDRQARARVLVRIGRMASGNFGDVKPVGDGVWRPGLTGDQATGCITPKREKS